MIKTEKDAEQTFERLSEPLPENAVLKDSFMSMYAGEVDLTPQKLRTIRPFTAMCLNIPSTLNVAGASVMKALFDCFEKAGEVREGVITDFVEGFSMSGYDPRETIVGLKNLADNGYIKFQTPYNCYIGMEISSLVWIRYQQKLLDMVYSK
jgi:hypothetical protein